MEARRQAVGAARRKAELYAEAAGVRLGAVLHIEDVVPDWGGRGGMAFAAESSSSGEVLVPGSIVVQAGVIIGFAIER